MSERWPVNIEYGSMIGYVHLVLKVSLLRGPAL